MKQNVVSGFTYNREERTIKLLLPCSVQAESMIKSLGCTEGTGDLNSVCAEDLRPGRGG